MGGRVAIFIAALLASAGTVHAQTSFDTIYGFGDSYADTNQPPGGVFNVYPFAPCDTTQYPECRFSSGKNFVDRLQSNFGIASALNFAYGGAETNDQNVASFPGLPFPGFVQEWTPFAANPAMTIGPDDIVALSIGGNNANAILGGAIPIGPDPFETGREFARTSADELTEGVQALVDSGARTIAYFSVGAPELYPNRGTDPASPEGIAAAVFLNDFRANSEAEFADIAAQGIRVDFFNFAELQRRILIGGEADRFGFYNMDGVPTVAEVPCAVGPCDPADAAGYFYWDGVHLTEAAYNLAADFMTIQLVQNETIPVQTELADIQARNFADTLSQRMERRRFGDGGFEPGYSTKDIPDPKRLSWKDAPAPVPNDSFGLFVAGGFGSGKRDDRDGAVGFDYDLKNIIVGAEWKAAEHTLLGGAIGYTNSSADYDFLLGHGQTDLDSVNIGAFASVAYPNWFADVTLAYAINNYDISRAGILLPETLAVIADTGANADGHSFLADFKTGYLFHSGPFGIGPIAGLTYSHVTVDGYTETGDSLLTMNVEEQTLESLTGSVGVELRYSEGGFEPYVAVTLEKEFMGDRSYDFALTSAPLVVNSIDVGEANDPYGRVRAGVKMDISDGLSGSIDGNATFGRDGGDDYALSGSLKYRF